MAFIAESVSMAYIRASMACAYFAHILKYVCLRLCALLSACVSGASTCVESLVSREKTHTGSYHTRILEACGAQHAKAAAAMRFGLEAYDQECSVAYVDQIKLCIHIKVVRARQPRRRAPIF